MQSSNAVRERYEMEAQELYRRMEKQHEEMLPGERMSEYLKGKPVDNQPYALLAPEDALADIWGFTKGEVHRSFDVRCEIMRRKREEYGLEGIAVGLGLRGMGEALGSELVYPEKSVDYVNHHMMDDYSKLKIMEEFDAHANPFLMSKIEEARRLKELFPKMGVSTDVAGPVTTAAAIRQIEMLLRDMRRDPEHVHRLISLGVECSLKWVQMFVDEFGPCGVGIADPVTTTDILGTKLFMEFSSPYLKILIDGIKDITGSKPSVHICGHTRKVWKDLVEAGIDNLSIDNCESIQAAKEEIGNSVFISGNVAPVDVMRYGTIDDVIKSVRQCLEEGSDSPSGYMLMQGCQIPIGTPKENIDAFIYAAREYGRGARLGHKCEGLQE